MTSTVRVKIFHFPVDAEKYLSMIIISYTRCIPILDTFRTSFRCSNVFSLCNEICATYIVSICVIVSICDSYMLCVVEKVTVAHLYISYFVQEISADLYRLLHTRVSHESRMNLLCILAHMHILGNIYRDVSVLPCSCSCR